MKNLQDINNSRVIDLNTRTSNIPLALKGRVFAGWKVDWSLVCCPLKLTQALSVLDLTHSLTHFFKSAFSDSLPKSPNDRPDRKI